MPRYGQISGIWGSGKQEGVSAENNTDLPTEIYASPWLGFTGIQEAGPWLFLASSWAPTMAVNRGPLGQNYC